MTLRYARLSPENLREAVKVLDERERLHCGYVKKGALAETKPTPRKHWRPQGDLNPRYDLD
jgi:hypothetical protein